MECKGSKITICCKSQCDDSYSLPFRENVFHKAAGYSSNSAISTSVDPDKNLSL